MAIERQSSASSLSWPRSGRLLGGGTTGNERLTAAAGGVLIVLLAVIGVTIIALRPLLSVHLFVGMLLIGPVALKLASTGYRFVRYYTANPSYRRKGPPPLALRLLAPLVVISTVIVLGSGVALMFAGPSSRGTLLPIHKLSFIAWVALAGLHILAHLPAMMRALGADYGRRAPASGSIGLHKDVGGRDGRLLSLAGALTFGVVLAFLSLPQFAAWLNDHNLHHH